MAVTIQVKRGLKANLPTLASGELAFTVDENLVYIGGGSENYLVGRVFHSGTAPAGNGVAGTLHVDTSTSGIYFSDGNGWLTVGITQLSDMQGNLDDIADGVNYQRVAASEVTASGLVNQINDGTNVVTAAQARTHIDDVTIHRSINDSGDGTTDLWSARKILDELGSVIRGIDWQDSVLDKDLCEPPPAPSDGDRYIICPTASGDWASYSNYVTEYITASGGWVYTQPNEGFAAWEEGENVLLIYNGSSWTPMSSVTVHNSLSGLQGGQSGEYYHLSLAEHTAVTSGLDETVQDIVGTMASGVHTYITVGYNDAAGLLEFTLNDHDHSGTGSGGTISHGVLTGIGANDHHNQIHGLVSSDHTVTTTSGYILRATGTNSFDFGALQFSDLPAISHSQLTNIGENDHHNRQHGFLSSLDHSWSGMVAGQFLHAVSESSADWTSYVDGGSF